MGIFTITENKYYKEEILMAEVNRIFTSFLAYLPNILKALVLLLIAWGIAVLVKSLIEKLLLKIKADEKLAKGKTPVDPDYGKSGVESISNIAYLLVFILFLPSILDALEMGSVAAPISNMMNTLLGFIPRLIGAGIILFVGFFLARLIKDLVFRFLQSVDLDRWYNKLNPTSRKVGVISEADEIEVTGKTVDKRTLSDVLSKIVFGIILIPVITMALETLAINTLAEPLLQILNSVMAMIPNIFVAILLVVIGYYISRFISQILEQLLNSMGIDRIFSWIDDTTNGDSPRFDLAKIIGKIVQALIMIFITVEALSILNLEVLNSIGIAVIGYIPLVLSGLIIISLGIIGGYVVEGLINKYAHSPFTAVIAKYIIIIFAVFMTLEQIKFASTIVNIAFLMILGGLSVAFALSFGLGGREFAKRQLEKFERKADKENRKSGVNDPLKNDLDEKF